MVMGVDIAGRAVTSLCLRIISCVARKIRRPFLKCTPYDKGASRVAPAVLLARDKVAVTAMIGECGMFEDVVVISASRVESRNVIKRTAANDYQAGEALRCGGFVVLWVFALYNPAEIVSFEHFHADRRVGIVLPWERVVDYHVDPDPSIILNVVNVYRAFTVCSVAVRQEPRALFLGAYVIRAMLDLR